MVFEAWKKLYQWRSMERRGKGEKEGGILDDCKKFGNEVLRERGYGIPVGQTRSINLFRIFFFFN